MPNGRSRDKGKRGELDVVRKLGGSARRVGHSYIATPVDIETDFGVYQIRNKPIGGAEILRELERLRTFAPKKNHYVVFKPKRGKWVIAEELSQHQGDHGEPDTLQDGE